jgi:hypothetical protein
MNEINKDEWCMNCDIIYIYIYIYININHAIMNDKHTLIYLS